VTVNSSGQFAAAGATNVDVGVTQADCASGDPVMARLYLQTDMMKAAGAITAGSEVYPAASGLVGGSAVGTHIGIAGEAATAAADVIEIFKLPN
jgi:hypothetical protein